MSPQNLAQAYINSSFIHNCPKLEATKCCSVSRKQAQYIFYSAIKENKLPDHKKIVWKKFNYIFLREGSKSEKIMYMTLISVSTPYL
jgi:hypothetical protein